MLTRAQFNNLDYRRHQIDTLKVFNDNVVEIVELEEYCVHFESAARSFILTVLLTVNFPNERPKLILSPRVRHCWVNPLTGEVEKAPGLLNYSPHSDLGRVVQVVIREFERFPPSVIKNSTTVSSSNLILPLSINISHSLDNINTVGVSNNTVSAMQQQNINNYLSQQASPHESSLTASNLPNLSTLSLDELKKLDNDPEFFNDFIQEMSVVQQLNEELDSMINQLEYIARENLNKEGHLVELKRKLSDDVNTLKNLGEKCDQLNKKYLKKSDDYAPQHIRELLQIAVSTADTECERHVEQFLNGKIDVQTFLQNYTHSKKLSSERKAKEERLGQQLQALERAGF
uniref:VPS37 C-terminal domain-containing protein n=2 Tax=Glossina morsitans morsitans TaxID=37546 RepID=A0A1B0FL22_GLOMM